MLILIIITFLHFIIAAKMDELRALMSLDGAAPRPDDRPSRLHLSLACPKVSVALDLSQNARMGGAHLGATATATPTVRPDDRVIVAIIIYC